MCCSVMYRGVVCCSVLQCAVQRSSVLQCAVPGTDNRLIGRTTELQGGHNTPLEKELQKKAGNNALTIFVTSKVYVYLIILSVHL